ncbi:MAG: EVE domain-containing protein, partial [Paludibacter sp.]
MIPKNITEANIIKAIENIDSNGIQYPLTNSKKYDLVYNGKTYPPKLVISLANEYANGEYPTHMKFNTTEAQKYLKDISPNFIIKVKGPNVIENLIERYKAIVKEKGLKDELYKWELIKELKGRPDVDAKDFAGEIKDTNSQENNLVYQMAKATANRMASLKSEEYRRCFQKLFDELISLDKRIIDFQSETLVIYKSTEGKHSSHHDERTISAYLTFHNPEKYTFYKSSYYNDYCKLIGIKPKEAGNKYVHYLELIHDLIDNYILEDDELLSLVDKELQKDDCYLDTNRLILAQDILYQTLIIDNTQTNYWVFQANPKYYDIQSALHAGVLKTWRVSQYKKEIKTGDKVILWITGKKPGIYALATVCSEVQKIKDEPEEVEFYIDKTDIDKEIDGVELELEFNLVDAPILKENLPTHPVLKDLKQGIQGTNLRATENEYNAILKLIDNIPPINMNNKENFKKWLLTNFAEKSGAVSAYISSLEWLSSRFFENKRISFESIFDINDINLIDQLHIEVKSIQKDPTSYIYNINATSYGEKNFYSASLSKYKEFLISIKTPKQTNVENFSISQVADDIKNSGLSYSNQLINRFTSSLLTKPFVILTGLSGSGKTKLAQAFAMWMCENENQYCIVPVGADWTNREPLLGFPNALESGHYVKPDNKVLDLIIDAMANEGKPYFLILDEMNLSHVERSFADFLSVMESGDEISLHPGIEAWGGV